MAKQARKGATAYVVLRRLENQGDAWVPVGRAEGHTKTEAIKAVAKAEASAGEEYLGGSFRAVPERSWPEDPELTIANEQRVISVFTEGASSNGRAEARQPAAAAAD